MTENGVGVIDLYGFTQALGLKGDDLFRDHTHFRQNVSQLQAAYISGILNYLAKSGDLVVMMK